MTRHVSRGGTLGRIACLLSIVLLPAMAPAAPEGRIKILFLGDHGHHQPRERFRQLAPALEARGIDVTYTDRADDMSPATLAAYDGLLVYANIDSISEGQARALLDYVASGKGFIPLHCASYCFRNSDAVVSLIGAQFLRHGTGVFRTEVVDSAHPVTRGFSSFESWDETYVHTKHNQDRTVLEVRADQEGREPWTWVRTHGKGRVFYTAWGHDERTWGNLGFLNLVERGIRWAVGRDPSVVASFTDQPAMSPKRTDVKPFEFTEANVPFYPAGKSWGTVGEPIKKMQMPLSPEESAKHLVHPADLEPRLFAAEPEIGGKPICMSWDERGRLWVSETYDYPNDLQVKPNGRDRIRICEDTDGDGRADKFTVFAEELSIPTSIAFSRGGAIVFSYPDTLFLKDNDGDGKADERRVLFTGWGTGDTHAGPSNMHYGPDNWIYGIVGYSGFEGTVGGERVSFRQAFYRFRSDGSKLEVLRNTNNNSWGVGFSEEGILFGSTANANPSEYMPIPNRYYEAVRGWSSTVLRGIAGNPYFHPITENVRQVDQHGRFTAGAGHALYTARAYPREYWNRAAFVAEPTGHLAATFLIQEAGSDFRSKIAWNLLASDDEWTAPIAAEVGPDGYVWVIDWYNFIVQHNPTPAGFRTGKGNAYVTDLRDKKHGRIYRLVPKGAAPAKPKSLAGASPADLVAALKDDNMFWRLHAERLLVERGQKDVVPELIKVAVDPSMDEIGLNAPAIHALWTLHGLGALDGSDAGALAAASGALKHRSPGVRRNALLVLPRTADSAKAIAEGGLVDDIHAQVRLAALLSLAEMPASARTAAVVVRAMNDESNTADRWLPDAITAAAAANGEAFLAAVLALPPERKASEAHRAIVARVAEHVARGAPSDAGPLLAALSGAKADGEVLAAAVGGLDRGWPKDKPVKLPPEGEKALATIFEKLPGAARGQVVSLAGRLGTRALEAHAAEIASSFLAKARDEAAGDAERVRAARELIALRRLDPAAPRDLFEILSARSSPDLSVGLIEAAGASEAPETAAEVLKTLPALTPAARSAAVRVLLGRAEWTRSLLEALEKGEAQLTDLTLDQRQALASHPQRSIATRAKSILERGGSLPSPDREAVLKQLLPLAAKKGDAALGKAVYLKVCSKCHVHGNDGTRIGPDLTGMAVHPKEELLTQVLDPSRSVEGNYRVYTIVSRDGQVLSGLLASETKTTMEVVDSDAKRHVVQREDVAQVEASQKSLMPEGFEKQLSPDDFVNLLEFLAQRGKYLPLPLEKAATVVSTKGMFFSEEASVERLVFADWSPKTFEGVPFTLVNPESDRRRNAILLYGPQGTIPPRMPKSVSLPVNATAKAIHFLSGVSGWGFPFSEKGSVTMIVRLHYADGSTEDQELKNGEQFADYIRRVDVPGSKFAFALRGQQIRYFAVYPKKKDAIASIDLVKGPDSTAPVVMAVTVEGD